MCSAECFNPALQQFYHYFGTVEASYLLLSFLSDPRSVSVKSRVLVVVNELGAVTNCDVTGAWAEGQVTVHRGWSHVFEGLIKCERDCGVRRRAVSRGLMVVWNEKMVDAKVRVISLADA